MKREDFLQPKEQPKEEPKKPEVKPQLPELGNLGQTFVFQGTTYYITDIRQDFAYDSNQRSITFSAISAPEMPRDFTRIRPNPVSRWF